MGEKRRKNDQPSQPTQWEKLANEFPGDPRLEHAVLYALPGELIDALETHASKLFAADELKFERRLRHLSATGFYRKKPIFSDVLDGHHLRLGGATIEFSLEAIADLPSRCERWLDAEFRENVSTDRRTKAAADRRGEIRESLTDRSRARLMGYAGWLVTNPDYWRDVYTWQIAYHDVFQRFGECSSRLTGNNSARSGKRRDIEFGAAGGALSQLLEKWCLTACTTFRIPEPIEPGMMVGDTIPSPGIRQDGITLFLPWPLLADRSFTIRELFDYHQAKNNLRHLDEWMIDSNELSYRRYGRMLQMYVYRHCALEQRYEKLRKKGGEALDLAFAAFWMPKRKAGTSIDTEVESIRKLRRLLKRRREACEVAADERDEELRSGASLSPEEKKRVADFEKTFNRRLDDFQRQTSN